MLRRTIALAGLLLLIAAAAAAQSPTRTPTVTLTKTFTQTPTRTPTFGVNDTIIPFAPESWVYDAANCKGPIIETFAGTLRTAVGKCASAAGLVQDCVPLGAAYDGGAFRFSLTAISKSTSVTDGGQLLTTSFACQCGGSGDTITSAYGTPQTLTYDLGNVGLNGRIDGETPATTCAGTCQPLDIMCWKMTTTATAQPSFTFYEWVKARHGNN